MIYTLTTFVISRLTDMDRVLLTVARFFSALSALCSASSIMATALRYLFMVRLATSSYNKKMRLIDQLNEVLRLIQEYITHIDMSSAKGEDREEKVLGNCLQCYRILNIYSVVIGYIL